MKNILLKTLILLAILFNSCKANSQIIIIRDGNNGALPSNYNETGQYYYKDVNNHLDNFTGTWEYVNGNEKFQIILTKIIKFHVVIPKFNLNYYEDGIVIQYKKFTNNILTFESPIYQEPDFNSTNGILLKGHIFDYGRITKSLYKPFSTEIYKQGGSPIYPHCRIEKVPNQPNKISFSLSLTGTINYDRETYAGQPTYSIPNDVVLTKQ